MASFTMLIFGAGIFLVQLICCFTARKKWVRLAPLVICLGYEAICLLGFLLGKLLDLEASLSFPAFILGYVGLYWCFAPVLSWMVYAVVRFVQKRK